ncbi:MAG: hypothetical protein M1504_01175 [Candidatus Marsarchaeota archaeon]|nr:hypothetical protein [Candidatus Marsarchaeota archaeon]
MAADKKAQFWSFDVIFAIVIFSIAITIVGVAWYNINNQLSLSYGNGATIMELQAKSLIQGLFSVGSPSDWQAAVNTTNTLTWYNVSAGFASEPLSSNLSMGKIYTLMAISNYNYQQSKMALGIGYDYYITINGGIFNITMGKNPALNGAVTVYVEKRSAFINGEPVKVTAMVWTNQPSAVS